MIWYYSIDNERQGPVDESVLRALAASGTLSPDSLVWREGMAGWTALRTALPDLFPPALQESGAGVPSKAGEPAGFWIRFAAVVIDGIVLQVGGFIAGLILGFGIGFVMGMRGCDQVTIVYVCKAAGFIIGIILNWLYFACMESSRCQATLGKMALGIKVTDALGNRLTFGHATGRHFAKILAAIPLGIGFMMAGLTDRKQALHDIIASTFVIRSR